MTVGQSAKDLGLASQAIEQCTTIITQAVRTLEATGGPDVQQVLAYDLAHASSGVEIARSMLKYAKHGELESKLTCAFVADVVHDLVLHLIGRENLWGVNPSVLADSHDFVQKYRDPNLLASLANQPGPRHLSDDFEMVQDTFRSFANKVISSHAEKVHRHNLDVPEEVIAGLSELGAFGLSIPSEYGGYSQGGESEFLASCIATEELSKASLGIGGSLITRPEILTRALIKGGTEQQKQSWLPRLATGEILPAVAVTEPDYGSDVAAITTTAISSQNLGQDGYLINGVKTWCTFAGRANVLMLLARTDPDRSKSHKGLSLFIVPKPMASGHGFVFNQPNGGKMEGRAIDTIGYRGMHSYEIALENWWVPADHLIGESAGLDRGFYFQMEGFANGRLQTAARAIGVMQAAYESACEYAKNRKTFGRTIDTYQLTQVKLGRMAVIIQGARQFSYHVAKLMSNDQGSTQASMVKAYACKASEWVTREAMQIHGGFGYAEEYAVSRLFVDARVLSIFEGADETLCLKVIARRLIDGQ